MFRLRKSSRDRAAGGGGGKDKSAEADPNGTAPAPAPAGAAGATEPHMNGLRSHHPNSDFSSLHPTKDSQYLSTSSARDMQRLADRSGGSGAGGAAGGGSTDPHKHHSAPVGVDSPVLGGGGGGGGKGLGGGAEGILEGTPDIISRAFNEALLPYQERIRRLESELARAQQSVQVLEAEKAAVHNWIDRRGLRPDLPADLGNYFAASPVAAGTLAAQLERKMTMLNYSLHQLGDVLPNPPPASTVTSALAALLPTVHQLAALPGGAAPAFEALIKLAGNLNSHGTGDETDADRQAIAAFYAELDEAMVRVVAARAQAAADGAEDWDVARDAERLQRTGNFLKKEMGVRNYFVRAQEAMRGEGGSLAAGGAGGGGRSARTAGTRAASGAAPGGADVSGRYSD